MYNRTVQCTTSVYSVQQYYTVKNCTAHCTTVLYSVQKYHTVFNSAISIQYSTVTYSPDVNCIYYATSSSKPYPDTQSLHRLHNNLPPLFTFKMKIIYQSKLSRELSKLSRAPIAQATFLPSN